MWPFNKTSKTAATPDPLAEPRCPILAVVRFHDHLIIHCACPAKHHVYPFKPIKPSERDKSQLLTAETSSV